MKAIKIIEAEATTSGRGIWYNNLSKRLSKIMEDPQKLIALSQALGHDPDYYDEDEEAEGGGGGDLRDPESLAEDPGWTWDLVREEFLGGRGSDDPETTLEIAKVLGVNTDGLDTSLDFDSFLEELCLRI